MNQPSERIGENEIVQYEWHPVLRALGWVVSWAEFAGSTAVVWDFLVNASLGLDRVLARAVVVCCSLMLLTVVMLSVDVIFGFAQFAWDQYGWPYAQRLIAVAGVVFLVTSVPYIWFVAWLLRRTWPYVLGQFASVRYITATASVGPISWRMQAALAVATAVLVWVVIWRSRKHPLYPYDHTRRILGLRKWIGGMCLMAYLRTLTPRRDFFIQVPIVSWMPALAGLTVLHIVIPHSIFAVAIPALLLMLIAPYWFGTFAPPVWIFLGTSERDSFRLFHDLRQHWRRHGLTLLNRTSLGGLHSYDDWRMEVGPSVVPYDPGIARIWSLRTRERLWQTAVRFLAAFVPVIIIDYRHSSEMVEFEVDWLKTRGYVHKAYVVRSPKQVQDDSLEVGGTVIDESELMGLHWTDSGLEETWEETH